MWKFLLDLKHGFIQFYYEQRIILLRSVLLVLIINTCIGFDDSSSSIQETVKGIIKGLPNMINTLKNACQIKINKDYSNKEAQEFFFQKWLEEEVILEIVFCILLEYVEDLDGQEKIKLDLLKYFKNYAFQGVYYALSSTSINREFSEKAKAIRDISSFTSMLCLSINIEKPVISDMFGNMIKEVSDFDFGNIEELLKFTGFIVGMSAAKQQKKRPSQVKEFAGIDFDSMFTPLKIISVAETLADMLDSDLMKNTEYDFMKGPLQNVVKHWIDKFYYIELDKDINEPTQNNFDILLNEIVMGILSDNYTLSDFWRYDIHRNSSFFRMINQKYIYGYPEEISKMCQMCYQLIGEKEYNYSRNLIDFLKHLSQYTLYVSDSSLLKRDMFVDGDDTYDFKSVDTINHYIRIPENTRATKVSLDRDYYQFEIRYDAMHVFFK